MFGICTLWVIPGDWEQLKGKLEKPCCEARASSFSATMDLDPKTMITMCRF